MRPTSFPIRAGALLLLAAAMGACDGGAGTVSPGDAGPLFNLNDPGPTNLRVSKTATASWTRGVDYRWTLEKTVSPAGAELGPGASATFTYTLAAVRDTGAAADRLTVSGEICVQNVGGGATASLAVSDNVQASTNGGSTWTTIASAAVDISAAPVIPGQQSRCYPYTVAFTPVAGAVYRNEGLVSITNYSGAPGTVAVFEKYAPFTLPASPTLTETDATAALTDALVCPAGFTCTPGPGPWTLTGTQTVQYAVTVTRTDAPCDHTARLANTATLTEGGSGTVHVDSAAATLTTPACAPPPDFQGCTPGYWKQRQHFGNWGGYVPTGPGASRYDAVFGVALFGPSTTLLDALGKGGGGKYRLGRHSAAALLNASNAGVAYGMTPAQVIAAVQHAVSTGDHDGAADAFEARNERRCPLGRAP